MIVSIHSRISLVDCEWFENHSPTFLYTQTRPQFYFVHTSARPRPRDCRPQINQLLVRSSRKLAAPVVAHEEVRRRRQHPRVARRLREIRRRRVLNLGVACRNRNAATTTTVRWKKQFKCTKKGSGQHLDSFFTKW